MQFAKIKEHLAHLASVTVRPTVACQTLYANRRHLRLLRPHRERPCSCRAAAEQRDELTPLHSITSSAVASSEGGTVRPSAFAVLRLMTSSNLVGCSTGKSPGLAPLRILST
jgi:hypothetical protein